MTRYKKRISPLRQYFTFFIYSFCPLSALKCCSLIRDILNRNSRLALLIFSSRMSNVQIFGQNSDQNALFLMERDGVGWIIFVVFLLVDSLGL